MSAVSIRAPKRRPAQAPRPSNNPVTKPVIKKEAVEVPVDTKKWTSYILRAGAPSPENEGTRYNVLRFQAGKPVNPVTDFKKPVKLARRDLFQAVSNTESAADAENIDAIVPAPVAAPKPQFSVAPHGAQPFQRKQFRKKTHEVYQQDENVRQLRQEERFPWVLSDCDEKANFQGALEGGQGNTYVFLKLTSDGFEVTPVSKFFKFTQRQKFQAMSLDEAEETMKKHKSLPRWMMKDNENIVQPGQVQEEPHKQYRMKTTSTQQRVNVKAEEQEEELDFNEDFADDEEQHGLVDDEEDNKELEQRIKKEQLSANAIGDVDADAEDEADEAVKAKLDKEGRRVQRFLEKLEKNNMYESDSNSNPYDSSSSSDSDAEDKDAKTSASVSTKGEDDEKKKSAEKTRDEKIRESVNKLQNVSYTTYNTPNGSTVISRTASSTNLSNVKAHARALKSRPQLITLKLAPSVLSKFSNIPSSAAGPQNKRRAIGGDEYDSDRSQKKLRFQSGLSPPMSRAASPIGSIANGPSRSASPMGDEHLITVAELKSIVQDAEASGGITMKALLRLLKPKLARDPRNKAALGSLMKDSGLSVVDGKLSVKQ